MSFKWSRSKRRNIINILSHWRSITRYLQITSILNTRKISLFHTLNGTKWSHQSGHDITCFPDRTYWYEERRLIDQIDHIGCLSQVISRVISMHTPCCVLQDNNAGDDLSVLQYDPMSKAPSSHIQEHSPPTPRKTTLYCPNITWDKVVMRTVICPWGAFSNTPMNCRRRCR